MFLGGVIWIGSHDLDPFKPISSPDKPTEVQVVSLDWKWLFIYPDEGVASVNELVVPAGVPVHFSLTSASVMNMGLPISRTIVESHNGRLWAADNSPRGASFHLVLPIKGEAHK